jgi:hypothetical protein
MAARLAILIALVLPAPASAAVTIGSSLPPWTGETLECTDPGGCTFVPRSIAGTVIAVPSDGVIVRWSARMPTAADTGPIVLRSVQLTPGGATAGGISSLSPPTVAGAIVQRDVRMAVHAGDLIGVQLGDGDEVGVASHTTFDSSSWSFFPLLSSERPPDSIDSDDFEALVNATIEPDVDRDGYGDETQDHCPQLAQETRECAEPPRLSLFVGRVGIGVVEVAKRIEVTAGVHVPPHFVPGAVLELTLPSVVRPVAIRGSAFCTIAGSNVTCPLGDLSANHGHTVVVEALALRPGDSQVRARLTTGFPGAGPLERTANLRVTTMARCGLAIDGSGGSERGTTGGDRITGARFADHLSGRAGDDCLIGRGGDDVLDGGDGNDSVDGGRGDDLVRGAAGDDRLDGGSGKDRFEGGPGNDRLDAVDGKRDVVRCGPGRDRARVDRADSVAGCERVALKR